MFCRLKDFRRIATRYDRLATNFLAAVSIAATVSYITESACGCTGLAFSMRAHQVAIPAWRWVHQKALPVEPLLRRIAAERIFLLSSGGSDGIGGSGKAGGSASGQ
jgi:hypothetical protein